MSQIKVEIILPLYYENKELIEKRKFIELYDKLIERFSGYSTISPLTGSWKSDRTGKLYKDEENVGLYVICEDSKDNKFFFAHLKQRLKKEFEQEDILMFYTKIDVFDDVPSSNDR